MKHSTVILILALAGAGLFHGCQEKNELPVSGEAVGAPFQEFDRATLYSYAGSTKKWRLQSYYMRKPLADTGTILAVPVVLSLFDSTGATTTRILSDSGTTTPQMEGFAIWGDVYVRTKDGLVVRTERLTLDNQTHMWHSDTFVEIRTAKGDVLRGKGFDAREDFSYSSFRQSVSGHFPEFRERAESDETFF
jgi:LPS export ABC transporter protein LptC